MAADWLRFFMIGEALFLLGFSIAVLQEAKKFRAPAPHIWWITLSYLILVLLPITEVIDRFGRPLSKFLIFGLISYTFGIFAMIHMWQYYKYEARYRRHIKLSDESAKAIEEAINEMRKEMEEEK